MFDSFSEQVHWAPLSLFLLKLQCGLCEINASLPFLKEVVEHMDVAVLDRGKRKLPVSFLDNKVTENRRHHVFKEKSCVEDVGCGGKRKG
nr:hypothetical protein [Tanacetum cinerariifolium]